MLRSKCSSVVVPSSKTRNMSLGLISISSQLPLLRVSATRLYNQAMIQGKLGLNNQNMFGWSCAYDEPTAFIPGFTRCYSYIRTLFRKKRVVKLLFKRRQYVTFHTQDFCCLYANRIYYFPITYQTSNHINPTNSIIFTFLYRPSFP